MLFPVVEVDRRAFQEDVFQALLSSRFSSSALLPFFGGRVPLLK